MWASYYGRRTLGSIFGLSRAAQVVGFAVGPLGSAILYDRTGTYQGAFLVLAITAVAAAGLLLTARRPALRGDTAS
jgi:MFS family permease